MIHKYIKVEEGSYRGHDMSGRIFPILKDYQTFAGDKEGGLDRKSTRLNSSH